MIKLTAIIKIFLPIFIFSILSIGCSNGSESSEYSTDSSMQTDQHTNGNERTKHAGPQEESNSKLDLILEDIYIGAIYDELIARSNADLAIDPNIKLKVKDTIKPLRIPELAQFSNKELYDAYEKIVKEKKQVDVIWEDDNRIELNYTTPGEAITSEVLRSARSIVALVKKEYLRQKPDGDFYIVPETKYGVKYKLCDNEKFRDQDIIAKCTGFAVDHNTIISAGHCVDKINFNNFVFIFDLTEEILRNSAYTIPASQVYEISQVIESVTTSAKDFSVLKVNRTIPNNRFANVNTSNNLDVTANYYIIGFPCGIPMKLMDKSSILEYSNRNYFTVSADTYSGNSGSPVFNAKNNSVVGILVGGTRDFPLLPYTTTCNKSVICYRGGSCSGEKVTRMSIVAPFIGR